MKMRLEAEPIMEKNTTFGSIIKVVIKHEGGSKYTNDPKDLGGETRYGISKRAHPEVDIKKLTIDGAMDIYRRLYWIPSKAEKIKPELRLPYFLYLVNAGQGNAVKCLQRACNATLPKDKRLVVDGRIGNLTIKATRYLGVDRLKAYILLNYAKLVLKNPSQERFWYGWYKRALT
jgi:lysozyme family protein|tara:strand:- start:2190 stop:2714 length:525 start_codon:yes stop_codon:yes gene_type:complete